MIPPLPCNRGWSWCSCSTQSLRNQILAGLLPRHPQHVAFVLIDAKWLLCLQAPCLYSKQQGREAAKDESTARRLGLWLVIRKRAVVPGSPPSSHHLIGQDHVRGLPQHEKIVWVVVTSSAHLFTPFSMPQPRLPLRPSVTPSSFPSLDRVIPFTWTFLQTAAWITPHIVQTPARTWAPTALPHHLHPTSSLSLAFLDTWNSSLFLFPGLLSTCIRIQPHSDEVSCFSLPQPAPSTG